MGELDKINFEDESITQFGVSKLEHLSRPQLMDAYACIMCNRCQDVCPANHTGKVLSPSALEINKRYQINQEGKALAAGAESSTPLIEFAISPEAVWACTSCGACIEVCPVGNEPMRDILDIRRSLVLMDNQFPTQLQQAFKGMERTGNPWNIAPESRLDWAKGFNVPTIEQNPEPDILWWVGCAPATDARAQKTAQAFAKVLNAAGVNFAVLGKMERCTGDSARRAGNEALFFELATGNVEMLNEVAPKRIVTTCPHCLHTLKNEYPAFGGNYEVIHHTQLIDELYKDGKLKSYPSDARRCDLPRSVLPRSAQSGLRLRRARCCISRGVTHRTAAPWQQLVLLRRGRRADVEGRRARHGSRQRESLPRSDGDGEEHAGRGLPVLPGDDDGCGQSGQERDAGEGCGGGGGGKYCVVRNA